MINPRLIKKRVNSISNINKITKALEMVAASKVQKAQEKALRSKPYAEMIYELTGNLSGEKEIRDVPLMKQPETIGNVLCIIISTNRGLVGSLNNNLFKKTNKHFKERKISLFFITVGIKGRPFAITKGKLEADFSDEKERENTVSAIVKIVSEGFIEGKYDEVNIAYNDFVSAFQQEPTIKKILPVSRENIIVSKETEAFELSGRQSDQKEKEKSLKRDVYMYEPDRIKVLNQLLPYYLEVQIAESLYEAEASEHSARMVAMKNASDSASELKEGLSLEYNKARQNIITTELSDITTAQASVTY